MKILALGACLIASGLLLAAFGDWLESEQAGHLVVSIIQSLADVLVVTGGIGLAIDFFTGREKAEADVERTRGVVRELVPDFTDAVLRGFAVGQDDLKRVATPELLDDIATNVLALRLGDEQFAREIYTDVRDQAIRASERWYDVDVNVRLSTAVERSANGTPLFDILVEWEYSTIPSHSVRKFACVSELDEFLELVTDVPATSAWFMPTRTGVDAAAQSSFELLSFDVDGESLNIRTSRRRAGQTYSVTLPEEVMQSGRSARIRSVYRTLGAQNAHRLFVEVPVPARDVSLAMDYTSTDISHMSVTDAVTSLNRPRITRAPEQLPGRELQLDLPGWILPRSGFAFVWTLSSEEHAPAMRRGPKAA